MTNASKVVELTVYPAPTIDLKTAQAQLTSKVEEALRTVGLTDLVAAGQIQVEPKRSFPSDQVVIVLVTFVAGIALESYKELIRREGEKLGQAEIIERESLASPDEGVNSDSDEVVPDSDGE